MNNEALIIGIVSGIIGSIVSILVYYMTAKSAKDKEDMNRRINETEKDTAHNVSLKTLMDNLKDLHWVVDTESTKVTKLEQIAEKNVEHIKVMTDSITKIYDTMASNQREVFSMVNSLNEKINSFLLDYKELTTQHKTYHPKGLENG